jgi:hypothetical protein
MTKKKQLIIIAGITGALGNSLLAKYSKTKNTICYGISRKSENIKNFINPQNKKLPLSTIIFSLSEMDNNNYSNFIKSIDFEKFSEIKYIHALGLYPFEIDKNGKHTVENDLDKDGINDTCKFLTYNVFKFITSNLQKYSKIKIKSLIFGSITDKHKPLAHQSWWKTISQVKEYMKYNSNKNHKMFILNISSVICTHEIITRPHVFTQTNANPMYWLTPEEVADKVEKMLKKTKYRYSEQSMYHIDPNFKPGYYTDEKFNIQKIRELFKIKKIKCSLLVQS